MKRIEAVLGFLLVLSGSAFCGVATMDHFGGIAYAQTESSDVEKCDVGKLKCVSKECKKACPKYDDDNSCKCPG